MIQSTEIKNLIEQFYAALKTGKAIITAEELFSQQGGFIAIGSEPQEWWLDAQAIIQGYQARLNNGGSEVQVEKIASYQEGTVGWVADRVRLITPDGTTIPVRHTYIFHLEDGTWKIIHAHYSLDVINENF